MNAKFLFNKIDPYCTHTSATNQIRYHHLPSTYRSLTALRSGTQKIFTRSTRFPGPRQEHNNIPPQATSTFLWWKIWIPSFTSPTSPGRECLPVGHHPHWRPAVCLAEKFKGQIDTVWLTTWYYVFDFCLTVSKKKVEERETIYIYIYIDKAPHKQNHPVKGSPYENLRDANSDITDMIKTLGSQWPSKTKPAGFGENELRVQGGIFASKSWKAIRPDTLMGNNGRQFQWACSLAPSHLLKEDLSFSTISTQHQSAPSSPPRFLVKKRMGTVVG